MFRYNSLQIIHFKLYKYLMLIRNYTCKQLPVKTKKKINDFTIFRIITLDGQTFFFSINVTFLILKTVKRYRFV